MNHMPYESWLFAEEPLSAEEQKALQAHLKECEHCRLLHSTWCEVKSLLQSEPVVEPKAGFAERWRTRLNAHYLREIERKRNRQSWLLFLADLGMAAFLLALLLEQVLHVYGTPIDLLLVSLSKYTAYVALLSAVGEFLVTILKVTLSLIPLPFWALFGFVLLLMNVFWIFSLRVLLTPWRLKS